MTSRGSSYKGSRCRDVDTLYRRLKQISESEYSDIVSHSVDMGDRLRIYMIDNSFLDVWFSRRLPCKYSFHWERRSIDGTVYRWDNAAHNTVKGLETFPDHFHEGRQDIIQPFKPADTMGDTLRAILNYVRSVMARR